MQNSEKIILHLCADVGSDTKPYRDAGYNVVTIGKSYGVENVNILEMGLFGKVYGIIANPVCTEFSIAPGFGKSGNLANGMFLVNHCLRVIDECGKDNLKFYLIENPATGRLKEFLGRPHYVYEPWWYGDPWTKKTALWGKFIIPQRLYYKWDHVPKNTNLYIRPNRSKPSLAFLHKSAKKYISAFDSFHVSDDMSFRSLCPQGFARAFFEANR